METSRELLRLARFSFDLNISNKVLPSYLPNWLSFSSLGPTSLELECSLGFSVMIFCLGLFNLHVIVNIYC